MSRKSTFIFFLLIVCEILFITILKTHGEESIGATPENRFFRIYTDNHFHMSRYKIPSVSQVQGSYLLGVKSGWDPNLKMYENIIDAYNIKFIVESDLIYYWQTIPEYVNMKRRRFYLIEEYEKARIYWISDENKKSQSYIIRHISRICTGCINNFPMLYTGKDCLHESRSDLRMGVIIPAHLYASQSKLLQEILDIGMDAI